MHISLEHYAGDRTDAHRVTIGPLILYFSYRTCVAFELSTWDTDDQGHDVLTWDRCCSENIWGPTTGKHINAIPFSQPRESRIHRANFESALADALTRLEKPS